MSQEMISPILKPMFGDMFGPIMGGGAPPATTIVSQTVLSDGVTLRLVGSVALTAGSLTGLTAANVTMASASIVGGNLDIVIAKVYDDQPVGNITYDGTGTLAGADGAVAAFGPVAITNGSAQLITGISGTVDLWKWNDLTRLWTTNGLTTNVSAIADPVGAWRGQLDAYTLATGAASNRPEYSAGGILFNSTSVYKELAFNSSVANNTPLTMLMRFVNTSGHNPRFASYVASGATPSTGITSGSTIFGRVRTGTVLNSGVSAVGDHCAVVSFDGTTAFMKVDNGATASITVGSDATARDSIKIASLLAGLGINNVKYLQAVAGGVSATDAQQWISWANSQP